MALSKYSYLKFNDFFVYLRYSLFHHFSKELGHFEYFGSTCAVYRSPVLVLHKVHEYPEDLLLILFLVVVVVL